LITPSNCHDLPAARELLPTVRPPRRLLADRAYDANSLREWLATRGVKAVISPNPTRKHPHRYDKKAYDGRNRSSKAAVHRRRQMNDDRVHDRGRARARFKIDMMNLGYNCAGWFSLSGWRPASV
jgi:IS5 family transposase